MSTPKLTGEQVVALLMVRLGCEFRMTEGGVRFERWFSREGCIVRPIDLTSLDALRPVLATLTNDEWILLICKIVQMVVPERLEPPTSPDYFKTIQLALTLPPFRLAHAIAEVIGKDL